MLIKYPALMTQLQKRFPAIYVLTGSDYYLLQQATDSIKKNWCARNETEIRRFDVATSTDWNNLITESNTYTLFAEQVLLEARFEKKTIDNTIKGIIKRYIERSNPRCLILLHAYQIPPKQFAWLNQDEQAIVVHVTPFSTQAMQQWIKTQLQKLTVSYDPEIPSMIQHYTQNNMLAAAQVFEKLALIYDRNTVLSMEIVRTQLIDQAEFQLYELTDACLAGQFESALRILRWAAHDKEPTLIVWLLTQEVRLLIELTYLIQQNVIFSTACNQLKIWPQRVKLFETALKRLPLQKLYQLLQKSHSIDECIKTQQNQGVWQALEQFAMAFK